MLAVQPAETTAERQPSDTRHGYDAERRREAVSLRCAVELTQSETRLRHRGALQRVNADALHTRQVEHQAAFADGGPGNAVPAAPNSQRQIMTPGEIDAAHHIARPRAAQD